MAKPPRPWTVLPHGPLEKMDDNVWAVESDVPGIPTLKRRMAIVRRDDGGLLFLNAVPVDDATVRLGVKVYAPARWRAYPGTIARASSP